MSFFMGKLNYYNLLGQACKLPWPPEAAVKKHLWDDCHKDQGTRCFLKLPSRRYGYSGVQQRKSKKMAPIILCPQRMFQKTPHWMPDSQADT